LLLRPAAGSALGWRFFILQVLDPPRPALEPSAGCLGWL